MVWRLGIIKHNAKRKRLNVKPEPVWQLYLVEDREGAAKKQIKFREQAFSVRL
jgi:hypothetical protein